MKLKKKKPNNFFSPSLNASHSQLNKSRYHEKLFKVKGEEEVNKYLDQVIDFKLSELQHKYNGKYSSDSDSLNTDEEEKDP